MKLIRTDNKLKMIAAFALLAVLPENSFAANSEVGAGLSRTLSHAAKRQYKLIFDSDQHYTSRDWLLNGAHSAKSSALFSSLKASTVVLPTAYDIRLSIASSISAANTLFPVYNQGSLGSCTANAAGAAMQFTLMEQKAKDTSPRSRLFIYYNERQDDPNLNVKQDTGASIADSIAAIAKYGACPESQWSYSDVTTGKNPKFTQKPSAQCYKDALKTADLDNLAAASIPQDADTIKNFKIALSQNNPVLVGLRLFSSFESATVAKTGVVPMPVTTGRNAEQLLGGHALMVTGYNDADQTFTVRNSWEESWGKQGYCTVPYKYFTNPALAGDFWVVSKVGPKTTTSATPSSNRVYPETAGLDMVKTAQPWYSKLLKCFGCA